MLHMPIVVNGVSTRVFFNLDISMNVLGPYHTCFLGMLWGATEYVTYYKTLGTCYLTCYVPHWYSKSGRL
jgi:hypothetical protein